MTISPGPKETWESDIYTLSDGTRIYLSNLRHPATGWQKPDVLKMAQVYPSDFQELIIQYNREIAKDTHSTHQVELVDLGVEKIVLYKRRSYIWISMYGLLIIVAILNLVFLIVIMRFMNINR